MDEIDTLAKTIWEYMLMGHDPSMPADVILLFGNNDIRTAYRAAELMNAGTADSVVVSGKATTNQYRSRTTGSITEAEKFAKAMMLRGVPEDAITLELKATNSGENVRFVRGLLEAQGNMPDSIILVQKPFMERRTYATFMAQWGEDMPKDVRVTSPKIPYNDYFVENYDKDLVINTMVGDLQRIKEYPKLGYQVAQQIPQHVWVAFESLVRRGYTKNLIQ